MGLNNLCGPSILYLGFSIIQIIIDIYKGLYNTTFIKFIVTILFTLFLNILCKSGLTVISWLVVFIPFISMTIITTLLLFVFGLDPASGNLNYEIMDVNNNFSVSTNGTFNVYYPDGSVELITLNGGEFSMLGQSFQLLNTSPISFRWPDGSIHTLELVSNNGEIRWVSNSSNSQYGTLMWVPVNSTTNPGYVSNPGYASDSIDPCPPNVTPSQFSTYYGGFCMTGNELNNLRANSSGTFRVLYYDGTSEIITLTNGSYTWQGNNYTIIDGDPLTIQWPTGEIQTLDVIQNNFIRWTTNSNDNKYSTIVWEPINNGLI